MRTLSIGLVLLLLPAGARAEAAPDPVRKAIDKGLRRLEKGSARYITHRQCFSCHHQTLTILALTSARRRGFTVAEATLPQQMDFTLDTFRTKLDRVSKGQAVPGGNTMTAYALFTLEAGGHRADQ